MQAHRIRILHISDLHERVALDWMPAARKAKVRAMAPSRYRVLDARRSGFFDILRELRTERAADLVCFTGDAADWGLAEEYMRATSRLDAILEAAGASRERLFVVPGNHDVQRKQAEDAWREMRRLAAVPSQAEALANWMAGLEPPYGANRAWPDAIATRTSEFWRWVRDGLGRPALDPAANPHARLGYRQAVAGLDVPFPVHVIGLDSAWLAGDDNDHGKLLLTGRQVDMLACGETGETLPGFRLCLAHHPLGFLADGDRCRRLLADSVDLVLHGHQHDPITEDHSDPDRGLRMVAAGSLYEGDEGDRWANSFHVIDAWLDDAGQPLWYDLEFYGWSDRGHWFRTGAIYRAAREGGLRWPTPLGQAWLARDARAAQASPHRRAAEFFIGREPELAQLRAALLAPTTGSHAAAIGAVQGMPGVGKSYLAERFAAQNDDAFPGGIVRITFGPDDSRDADAICRDLCDAAGLRAGSAIPVPQLLRDHLRASKALLILENADTESLAHVSARLVTLLASCPMIVTGRYRALGRSAGWMPVTVTPFDEPYALAQLYGEHRAPADAVEAAAFRELAARLGFLPLAIHLAAGYLAQPGATPAGFLRELAAKRLVLAHPDPADPAAEQGARAILAETFALSLTALWQALAPDGDRLLAAFAALGRAPLAGFGPSLGMAIAGVEAYDFERLTIAAGNLSLLECGESGQRFRVHPLLAELLRLRVEPGPVVARMTDWFLARLPEQTHEREAEQRRLWGEIQAESPALVQWLPTVPADEMHRVERAGSIFALRCGPFRAWLQFCERGLQETTDPDARSDFLWTLGQVAKNGGELERALEAARQKVQVDRDRSDDREVALAQGLIADVLQARGELDEALRIRREEQLPVYERLGDVRSRAVTLGQIADVLQARGELDEALRIRREEELPTYERLGDVRSRAVTLGQIADVLQARGELDEALRIRREEQLPVYERLGDVRERAVTLGKIADVLQARGELDEALRIRREEQLPVYERLGDVRSRAVTLGKIADVLQARGELDEALRIRREEELPTYERLGDVRSRAVTLGQIADVLQARGELDEALRIRREEQLPVYERLGDVRERAVTLGKIADVLRARGELDEALRTLQDEALPAFERLGDVRSRAVTLGQIADVLQARGELDEALRIRREEQLPVYERLGDVRSRAVTLGKIADVLQARGELDEALRTLQDEALPAFERLGDVRSRAVTLGQIADVLQARGELDEALRIRREEELPTYERLGSRRDLLVGRANMAIYLLRRSAPGDRAEARRLLNLALVDARAMRIPEAGQIEAILRQVGE